MTRSNSQLKRWLEHVYYKDIFLKSQFLWSRCRDIGVVSVRILRPAPDMFDPHSPVDTAPEAQTKRRKSRPKSGYSKLPLKLASNGLWVFGRSREPRNSLPGASAPPAPALPTNTDETSFSSPSSTSNPLGPEFQRANYGIPDSPESTIEVPLARIDELEEYRKFLYTFSRLQYAVGNELNLSPFIRFATKVLHLLQSIFEVMHYSVTLNQGDPSDNPTPKL